jgi:hypothetical protein
MLDPELKVNGTETNRNTPNKAKKYKPEQNKAKQSQIK